MKTNFHSIRAGHLDKGWRSQRFAHWFTFAVAALLFSSAATWASDPVGLYAIVDKVKFEPSDDKPERVMIWGTFSVAEGDRGEKYRSPEKGYIYLALPEKKAEVAQKEWADLKSVAGKHEIVGFSTRWGEQARVRKESDQPKNPDIYRIGIGVVRMGKRGSDYPPVKALLDATKQATKQT